MDTLLPAGELNGKLKAAIELVDAAAEVPFGRPLVVRVRVTNQGTVTWKARGRRFGGQVTCGVKVCDAGGNVLREDLGRTSLASDLVPGAVTQFEVTIPGVLPPGRYELRYDMVVEGVTWFEFQASRYARHVVTITA